MQVRKMRLLRHKYGITCPELGRACGLSPQRISEIELSAQRLTPVTEEKLRQAFSLVAEERRCQLSSLHCDLEHYSKSLFDAVEESAYEL